MKSDVIAQKTSPEASLDCPPKAKRSALGTTKIETCIKCIHARDILGKYSKQNTKETTRGYKDNTILNGPPKDMLDRLIGEGCVP
jgi:hypothetical protein